MHLKWEKNKNCCSPKSKGVADYPGAKGNKGIPPGPKPGRASVEKGSDYPAKKGDKGVGTGGKPKTGHAPKSE